VRSEIRGEFEPHPGNMVALGSLVLHWALPSQLAFTAQKVWPDVILYCTISVSEAVCDVAPDVAFTFSV
jgi:hypothetical protein